MSSFKKVLSIGVMVCLSGLHGLSFAAGVTTAPKATATLVASCQIQAFNVNFGSIDPKISSTGVTASSTMNLFCSKGAAYSIALNGANANYTIDGDVLGRDYSCPNNCSGVPINTHYYYVYAGSVNYAQTPGSYVSRSFIANGTTVQNYSMMKGAVSGDTITYKITLPGDDTKIWNRGNYSYANTGTGDTQTFAVKATATTATYPTPDSYSDTVTAIVTF